MDALAAAHQRMAREVMSKRCSIWVSLDVAAAFDSLSDETLGKYLCQCSNTGPRAFAALRLFQIVRRPRVTCQWQGRTWDLMQSKGIQQGGSHSAMVFSMIIDEILAKLNEDWLARGFGSMHGLNAWAYVDDILLNFQSWEDAAILL